MRYLHTMVRISNVEESLDFFCKKLGMEEVRRYDSEQGRYTNIFLAAADDIEHAKETKAPVLELTYNWPARRSLGEGGDPVYPEHGRGEEYTGGRNFGHLAYEVDNIYETCQKLMDGGITINRPPRDGRMAFIKTPDNISIELLQKGEPLPIGDPWASMENTGSW